jgi:hypothetical protein
MCHSPASPLLGHNLPDAVGHDLHVRKQLALIDLLVLHRDRADPKVRVQIADGLGDVGGACATSAERSFIKPPDYADDDDPEKNSAGEIVPAFI